MKLDHDEIDERLQRLSRATEGVRPSAAFAPRVLRALAGEHATGWVGELLRGMRRLLAVAAVAAVAALVWAVRAELTIEDAWAASSDAVELRP